MSYYLFYYKIFETNLRNLLCMRYIISIAFINLKNYKLINNNLFVL